jgi:VWFA-related protein
VGTRLCVPWLVLSIAIALSGAGHAQAPPIFRSTAELVEVGVVVIDREGKSVQGLTREDFELLDEGHRQPIQAFSAIEVSDAPRTSAAGAVTSPSDIVTTPGREGRLYVLVLDAPSTATMPADYREGQAYTLRTKQVAKQFVEEVMRPGDQVAVVHAQGTARDAQTFTTDRRLLLASIERFGRGLSGNIDSTMQGKELVARNLTSYAVIRSLAERLGAIDGKRKAIIWIGGQIDFNPARISTRNRTPGSPRIDIADSAAELDAAYRETIRAAGAHNVAVYSVDPAGAQPDVGEDEQSRVASLRAMAEETGALAVVNTNSFSPAFARISSELSSSYVLGFAPDAPGRTGFHRLTVRVRRPGLTVRARRFVPGAVIPPRRRQKSGWRRLPVVYRRQCSKRFAVLSGRRASASPSLPRLSRAAAMTDPCWSRPISTATRLRLTMLNLSSLRTSCSMMAVVSLRE